MSFLLCPRKPNHNKLHCHLIVLHLNTLGPRQNGRHFADDTFKCIFLNENVCILIEISLKCVPKGPINNMSALVQIMAWRWPGGKSLSEPTMDRLLTHVCVTRLQWGLNEAPIRPQWGSYSASSHYLNQCWVIVVWTLRTILQWNFNQSTKFIPGNAYENIICETAANLSRERWVNAA